MIANEAITALFLQQKTGTDVAVGGNLEERKKLDSASSL
jgi:hypothetical protein